ncbi:ABC transporter ATP-binding protein/permease [Candidatus Babeliales bacterium]|nr:ABC transporter ATP-binding protein/permease [Candidatus Babeliales bacterium]MCF7899629.1 ABC transporter ATP-binding protein/permease [Candidatus Babeliales bacterium]
MVINFLKKFSIENINKNLNLLPIDFKANWFKVFITLKKPILMGIFGETINSIFNTLCILFIGWTLSSNQLIYLLLIFIFWSIIYMFSFFTRTKIITAQIQLVHSINFRAHQTLLQIDPIFHTKKSTGTVLSKIKRGSKAFEDLLDSFFYDILPLTISLTTIIISLSAYNLTMGAVTTLLLISIIIVNLIFSKKTVTPLEKKFIKTEDKLRAISLETINQINLIRTSFATKNINKALKINNISTMHIENKSYFFYLVIYTLVKFLYLISLVFLSFYVFFLIKNNTLSVAIGISLIVMYMRSAYEVTKIERPVRHITKSLTRINDLFSYIKNFGEQTFPVLPQDNQIDIKEKIETNTISISMENILFTYGKTAKIFDGHNLNLTIQKNQENKLYGIIGPSGIGKSTILSILGGQLKPEIGTVKINDIDIYKIDDLIRQKLIALQGQVSSQMFGTLRYNLLFGLPQKENQIIYSDETLIEILEKIDIWHLFKNKEKLDTSIGESGLNLSGGQRQRLNFANLYLRANYFNPPIVLIDEPTSSLDTLSERTITDLILSIAKKSLTIVIAHRIITIKDAVGILDFSLLTKEKEIKFYTHEELITISSYYKYLISGIKPL